METPREDRELVWRIIFSAAALYNIAFGVWAVLFPSDFFARFDLETPQYLWLWSCLGMVIGVYGLGYAYVALKPERGDVIIALGLLGKILGPIGWLLAVHRHEIPPRTFPVILLNDLIWWFPFGWYLLRHAAARRMIIAMMTVALHVAASATLWMMRGGTEVEPEVAARLDFIQRHAPAWTTYWFLWTAASISLLAFFIVWASRLRQTRAALACLLIGCCLCALGLLFDLTSEWIAIAVLTDAARGAENLMEWRACFIMLGPGAANGLYSVAGFIMWIIAWRTGFQRGAIGMLGLAVWLAGVALTGSALARHEDLMPIFGGALMLLFIPWAAITALSLRSPPLAASRGHDSRSR